MSVKRIDLGVSQSVGGFKAREEEEEDRGVAECQPQNSKVEMGHSVEVKSPVPRSMIRRLCTGAKRRSK